MPAPKVSIIIPTHSRPHLLPRAVASAREAGESVEIVVVDDASADGTAEVCRSLRGVRHVRLDCHQGVAGARNVGILASSADYVAFLDDDDVRLPGSLDWQVEALESSEAAGFVCGGMLMADQEGRLTGEVSAPEPPGGDIFWDMIELKFPVMPISVVVRRECFSRVGLLNSGLPGIDDWDMLTRIAEFYPALVIDHPVSIYRKPTPLSGQGSSAQARHLAGAVRHQAELLRRLARARAASPARRRQARRRAVNRVADTLLWNAAQAAREGSYAFARANVMTAVRLNPARALRPAAYRKLAAMIMGRASVAASP